MWERIQGGLLAFLLVAGPVVGQADTVPDCHVGSYRLQDGRAIDIDAGGDGALRWRLFSGETGRLNKKPDGSWLSSLGWTGRPDGISVSFSDCASGEVHFGNLSGHRLTFDVTDTAFESGGTKLVGRLVMPKGRNKVPVVVLVHGAEHDSARDTYELQRMFPAAGIGAFVYDKRGTGASAGSYNQDFDVLANDVTAALREARRLAGARIGRIGYQGGSAAGWVLPLALSRARVDFAIVSFGLAVTVMEEDQESVALDMYFHHHSLEYTRKALALARSGEHVIETGGAAGYKEFDRLRRTYKTEPWFKDVHGDFLFFILPLNKQQIMSAVAENLPGTPFRYEPMPALRASATPLLWVLGSDDLEAPCATTAGRIRSLIDDGKEITLAVYPGAEHGMTQYELNASGKRVSTRYAPGYFSMMRDFIRDGKIGDQYGSADLAKPGRVHGSSPCAPLPDGLGK